MSVRFFGPADAEAVAAMMVKLAQFHDDESHVKAADFLTNVTGPHALSTIWIAETNDEIVGFAATYDWMNYVRGFRVRHIDLMFVEQRARKLGVGRELAKSIAAGAKLIGCGRVTVGAAGSNQGANNFYQSLGFKVRTGDQSTRYMLDGATLDELAADYL